MIDSTTTPPPTFRHSSERYCADFRRGPQNSEFLWRKLPLVVSILMLGLFYVSLPFLYSLGKEAWPATSGARMAARVYGAGFL